MACTIVVTAADGTSYRFGHDAKIASFVPIGLNWGSVLPGGWKGCGFSLARIHVDIEDPPLRLFDEVVVYDEALEPVYEGLIVQLPRRDDATGHLVDVQCMGWAQTMTFDPSHAFWFVDHELGRWRNASAPRRRFNADALVRNGQMSIGAQAITDVDAQPALTLELQGTWAEANGMRCEAYYDAPPGTKIARVDGIWKSNVNVGTGAGDWWFIIFATDDEAAGFPSQSVDYLDGTHDTGFLDYALDVPRRTVLAQLAFITPNTLFDVEVGMHITYVGVYGDTGLTPVADPETGMRGFYIDDMLAYALATACPKLNFSTGPGGTIERPPYVVVQAAYEASTVDQVVQDLNKYVLWEWLVYRDRTFHFRQPNPDRFTWRVRLDRGATANLEGDDSEHAINGVIVKYQTPDGTIRYAGPTGSGYDIEAPGLGDFSVANEVNRHGHPRKWAELEVPYALADPQYALAIGTAYMQIAAMPARSGDITVVGEAYHPDKGWRPVREMLAGDWVVIEDAYADVPRRIVATQNNEDERSNRVSVGNEVARADALLERAGVKTRRF